MHSCFSPDNQTLIREEFMLTWIAKPARYQLNFSSVLLSAILKCTNDVFPWFLTGLGKVSLLCFLDFWFLHNCVKRSTAFSCTRTSGQVDTAVWLYSYKLLSLPASIIKGVWWGRCFPITLALHCPYFTNLAYARAMRTRLSFRCHPRREPGYEATRSETIKSQCYTHFQ